MQSKQLIMLTLASIASAQDQDSLIGALGGAGGQLSTLNTLLGQNPELLNSLNNLKNVTILAPNNDALNSSMSMLNRTTLSDPGYLQQLLTYHVINGTYYNTSFTNTSMFLPTHLTNQSYTNVTGGQRVEARMSNGNVTFFSALKQNASVVAANMNYTGGTIHIIDGLLSIPGNDTYTLSQANLTAAAGAIRDTNLTDGLSNQPDITIFAPVNDAFNAIGSIVGNLTGQQLNNILGYHILNGTVAYSDMLKNTSLMTTGGQNITITNIDGQIFANNAKVLVPNILCENGVIHKIDGVLNPDNTNASPNPTATTTSPAFSGASSGTTGVPFTSGISTPESTNAAATSSTSPEENGNGGASSTSSEGAGPIQTAAIGAAALFGGAALYANF